MSFGFMSVEEVKTAVTWGMGPKVTSGDLSKARQIGETFIGANGSHYMGEITIDKSILEELERAVGANTDAALLLVASTLLHELTHYGNYISKMRFPGESGEAFEKYVYGRDIDNIQDAWEVLRNYNKPLLSE